VCFVWISKQTADFALYDIKRLVFIAEVESVCSSAVRTESLYNTDTFCLGKVKGNIKLSFVATVRLIEIVAT